MSITTQIKQEEHARIRLSVTVSDDQVRETYRDIVKDYAKKALVNGFRKGKVPPAVLERKFGEALRAEALEKLLESTSAEALESAEFKPITVSTPTLEEDDLELDPEKELSYSMTYDTFPTFEVPKHTDIPVERPAVSITDEDLDRELKAIQEQNALVVDKDDPTVEADDIATVDYVLLADNGDERPDTRRQDFGFQVGRGQSPYGLDTHVLGMKVDERKEVTFAEGEGDDATEAKLAVTVTAVRRRDLPEIDDDLAQDVNDEFETLDDLKASIRSRLESTAENRVREITVERILDAILENVEIDLPKSMVDSALESRLRSYIDESGLRGADIDTVLDQAGTTREAIYEKWRPEVEARTRRELVVNKLGDELKIEASDEEVDERIRETAGRLQMDFEAAKGFYETNGMLDYVRSEIRERRVHDYLIEHNAVTDAAPVSFLDLMGGNA